MLIFTFPSRAASAVQPRPDPAANLLCPLPHKGPCQQQDPPPHLPGLAWTEHEFARCPPDTHLSAELEGHDRVVLGVQDEQGAGDMLHAAGREKGAGSALRRSWGLLGSQVLPTAGTWLRERFTVVWNASNCGHFNRELAVDFLDVSINIYSR